MMSSGQSGEVTLTPRQQQITQFIEACLRDHGYSPSMREIGDATGLASTSSVSHQLSVLEKKGIVVRGARRPTCRSSGASPRAGRSWPRN